MIKLKAGDVVDVSHWDGLTVLRVDSKLGDYVKVDVSALGDSVPDYFSVKEIDGWTDGDIGLNRSDDGIWLGLNIDTGEEFQVHADGLLEVMDKVNSGDLIISDFNNGIIDLRANSNVL